MRSNFPPFSASHPGPISRQKKLFQRRRLGHCRLFVDPMNKSSRSFSSSDSTARPEAFSDESSAIAGRHVIGGVEITIDRGYNGSRKVSDLGKTPSQSGQIAPELTTATPTAQSSELRAGAASRSRTLWTACMAHALHDGCIDLIYLLLPVWQAEFGLGYSELAFFRGLAAVTLAGLQVPAGRLAERFGGRTVLAIGTALVALG